MHTLLQRLWRWWLWIANPVRLAVTLMQYDWPAYNTWNPFSDDPLPNAEAVAWAIARGRIFSDERRTQLLRQYWWEL